MRSAQNRLNLVAATLAWTAAGGCAGCPSGAASRDAGGDDPTDEAADVIPEANDEATLDETTPDDGTPETPGPVEPVLERYDVEPCGDWEVMPRTAPSEPPPGVEGLFEKWRYNISRDPTRWEVAPYVRCCAATGALAERPDGDVCFVMAFESIVCVNRDARLEWGTFMGGPPAPFHPQVVHGPVVLPDGAVAALTNRGLLRAANDDGAGMRIVWETAVEGVGPDTNDLPPGSIQVVAGGYIMVNPPVQPGDRVHLLDRCGRRVWTMRGLGDANIVAGVGNEGIGRLQDGSEWRTYALSTDGSFMMPVEIAHDVAFALGGRWYGALDIRYGESFVWWTAERGGGPARSVVLEGSIHDTYDDWAAVAADGAVVLVQTRRPPDYYSSVSVYNPDGTLRWSHRFRPGSDLLAPLIGRDGRIVVLEDGPGSMPRFGVTIYIFDLAGAVEATLDLSDCHFLNGSRDKPLLSQDGVLYLLARDNRSAPRLEDRSEVLVAVQTSVPGARPDDPGAPMGGYTRTSYRDNWGW